MKPFFLNSSIAKTLPKVLYYMVITLFDSLGSMIDLRIKGLYDNLIFLFFLPKIAFIILLFADAHQLTIFKLLIADTFNKHNNLQSARAVERAGSAGP